jgi:glycosyltransferase involved in cell wall biosynthesis
MVALALHRMDHIATVSAVGRADLIQNFGVRAERVSVLYRGVPFTAERSREERRVIRDRLRQNFSMPTDCRVVAHVGSFTPEKNHADLLRSFGELLSSNVNAVLLLVGDGPLRGEIERQIERTLPSGRVIVAGYRRDATELLEAVDVLALPSVAEGLPGVILEAAMAGVPAVAYDVGGVAEAITDRSSGILVRPGDVSGFTQALLTVLGDAEMRERMGQHARRRAVEDFDCSRSADRFVSLYGAVIRTQSGGEPPGGA